MNTVVSHEGIQATKCLIFHFMKWNNLQKKSSNHNIANKNHVYKHDIEIDQPKTQLDSENKKFMT